MGTSADGRNRGPDARFDWHEVARLALLSRTMDEMEEQELGPKGLVPYQFSCRGHELGQLLIAQLLTRPWDGVCAYYRSRPFVLASGWTADEAMASDMAKPSGSSAGRDVGAAYNMTRRGRALVLPIAGDVGSQFTPAAGWAQAIRYRADVLQEEEARGSIAVVFCGEGAVATNGFWSSLTQATTLRLPLLFVVEDNGYAISVRSELQTPGANIAANLASFGNLVVRDGDGTDPVEASELIDQVVGYVREWRGPALLRLRVPRLSGHSSVDNQAYKTEEEWSEEWARDPISGLERYLVPRTISEDAWEDMRVEARTRVEAAVKKALAEGEPSSESAVRYELSEPAEVQRVGGLAAERVELPRGSSVPRPASQARMNMIEAIRRTLDVELDLNPRMLLFGEDVALKGGVHAATMGLMKKHGEARVFDTSLSEEGIIGRSVGMAYAGLLPVPEIQFRKYADPATEQINNLGSVRWRTRNHFAAPMVVRMPGGYRKVGDPWHSVTQETVFAHAPGWLLAFPSNAEDAVGLLRSALRGNDPVIFFEHRAMLDASWARRPYPGDDFVLPFGQANRISEGDDLTVVTWGAMVERCVSAAEETGASVEILDLRTIVPWDREAVLASVRKTSRCLIVHEDILSAGFGAEIAAVVAAGAFLELDAPIERIGSPRVPVPYNSTLMDGVVPTVERIRDRMEAVLRF